MKRCKKAIGKCGMTKKARVALGMRQVASLGMWALDRGMGSCNMTPACAECYNRTPGMKGRKSFMKVWGPGGKDDQAWAGAVPACFKGLARVALRRAAGGGVDCGKPENLVLDSHTGDLHPGHNQVELRHDAIYRARDC